MCDLAGIPSTDGCLQPGWRTFATQNLPNSPGWKPSSKQVLGVPFAARPPTDDMVGRGIVHQLISAGPDELVRNSPWKVSGAYSRLAQEGSWLALIASSFALSSHGARGRDFKS